MLKSLSIELSNEHHPFLINAQPPPLARQLSLTKSISAKSGNCNTYLVVCELRNLKAASLRGSLTGLHPQHG